MRRRLRSAWMSSLVVALSLAGASCHSGPPQLPPAARVRPAKKVKNAGVPAPSPPAVAPAPPAAAPVAKRPPERARRVTVRVPPGHRVLRIQVGLGADNLKDLPLDAAGSATILPRDEGGLWFYVRAIGDGDLVTPWTYLLHEDRDIELALAPGAPLAARIVDESSGAPVNGALVTITEGGTTPEGVSNPNNLVLATRRTRADGGFWPVTVPRGRAATLSVKAEGHAHTERSVWVPAAGEIPAFTVEMEPGGTLSGVVRSPDGRPVAGARVGVVTRQYVGPAGEPSMHDVREGSPAQADADGAFRIKGLKLGVEWYLVARADAWAGSRASGPVVLTRERPDVQRDVLVRAPGRLDVIVVDSGGLRIGNARVAWEEGGMTLDSVAKEVEPGRHRFDQLEPCVIPLTVTAPGYAPVVEYVEMHESEKRELVLRMVPPAEIRGRVVDDLGGPVPQATLRWSGERGFSRALRGETRTGADGAFVASGLQAGSYRFSLDAGDVDDAASVFEAPAKDVVVRMVRRGAIVFRLRLPPGAARPEGIGCELPNGSGTAMPSGDGWRVDDLRVGRRKITLRLAGFDAVPIEADVRPGADSDAGEFALVAGATWRGRVVDADGRPIAGALVQRYRDAGWPVAETAPVRSDADGRFVVEHVDSAPETYLVQAEGFADDRPKVGGASPPSTVTLRRGSLVSVQAVGADGKPSPGGLLRALLAGTGDEDDETLRWILIDERGRGAVRLPPGKWRIGDGAHWQDVETRDGSDVDVKVTR